MTNVTRTGFKKLALYLGEAYNSVFQQFGDLNKNGKSLLGLESILCKLRGSTFFYNEDYGAAYYQAGAGDLFFPAPKFDDQDLIGIGNVGNVICKDNDSLINEFPTVTGGNNWNPIYFGPPSTEGFGAWYYSAWKFYKPYQSIDVNSAENGNYVSRYNYEYPVRYNPSISPVPYERVSLFAKARYISLYNNSQTARTTGFYTFKLKKSLFRGCIVTDHQTDFPKDLRFMYYEYLVQKLNNNIWEGISGLNITGNLKLNSIGYQIENDQQDPTVYVIKLNIPTTSNQNYPTNITYSPINESQVTGHAPQTWWHVIMYWGSADDTATTVSVPFYSGTEYSLTSNQVFVWPTKIFFNRYLDSKIKLLNQAIFRSKELNLIGTDQNYVIAKNRYHHFTFDGSDSYPDAIFNKYEYARGLPILNGILSDNSITEFFEELEENQYQSAIITVKTLPEGDYAINIGFTEYKLVKGPKFYSDFATEKWEDFAYFPQPEDDYFTLARMIIRKSSIDNYEGLESTVSMLNNNVNYVSQKNEIIWFEQNIYSHAVAPHGDPEISKTLLPALNGLITNFRFYKLDDPILLAGMRILTYASQTPDIFVSDRTSILQKDEIGSTIFRRLLKNPIAPELQPDTDEALAFAFESGAIKLIENVASAPPSTEFLRFTADNLLLTGKKLTIGNSFELYMEPSDNCTAADESTAGNRLGLDYTLRLTLEDSDENLLRKDWFIMASKYYITNQEYSDRIANEQSTVGYITEDILNNNIDLWYEQKYAAIVPDLSMGNSRVLTTRFQSPRQRGKQTEAEWRADQIAQGKTEDEIEELYLNLIFEDPNYFIIINNRQHNDQFVALRESGLNITILTEADPYWKSNLNFLYNNQFSGFETPEDISIQYSDSFSISVANLNPSALEGEISTASYTFEPSPESDLILETNRTAFKISVAQNTSISNIQLKLKSNIFNAALSSLSNADNSEISLELYSSENNLPDALLAKSSNSILYSDLVENTYNTFNWFINSTLIANNVYWVILNLNSNPIGGDIIVAVQTSQNETAKEIKLNAFSFVSNANLNLNSALNIFQIPVRFNKLFIDASDSLTPSNSKLNFYIYSDLNGSPNQPISFTSAKAYLNFSEITTNYLNFNLIVSNINFVQGLTYWIVAIQEVRSRDGEIQINYDNIGHDPTFFSYSSTSATSINKWDNWNSNNYKAWMKAFNEMPEIYAHFNRDTFNEVTTGGVLLTRDDLFKWLPPKNVTRIVKGLPSLEASWAFTNKKFSQPTVLNIYPRYSEGFIRKTGTITAIQGNTAINGVGTLFLTELKVGYKIYNIRGQFVGTVQNIISNTNLTLSSAALRNVSGNYNSAGYVPFFRDIYVSLRLMVGGKIKDYFLYLEKDINRTEPIQINVGEEAEYIVYMHVAKSMKELLNGYHGAPASDRLVLRSS